MQYDRLRTQFVKYSIANDEDVNPKSLESARVHHSAEHYN